jgi:tetrapyrrole methylase family protein/MazG family protein
LAEVEEAYAKRESNAKHYFQELGDLLYSLIKLCHWSGVSPDEALALSTKKYANRLAYMEKALETEGKKWGELKHQELEHYWRQAKASGL